MNTSATAGPRLDKWLWAARFYKTRSLAAEDIGRGRIRVNGQVAKASRELRLGDELEIHQVGRRTVRVLGLGTVRGPAPVAQAMYRETPASVAAREQLAEARRLAPEPALTQGRGRPTKRDRRALDAEPQSIKQGWQRWSASIDDSD